MPIRVRSCGLHAKQHLQNLPMYYINAGTFKFYGVDGDIVPVVADRDGDGIIEPIDGDFVHIPFGMPWDMPATCLTSPTGTPRCRGVSAHPHSGRPGRDRRLLAKRHADPA